MKDVLYDMQITARQFLNKENLNVKTLCCLYKLWWEAGGKLEQSIDFA